MPRPVRRTDFAEREFSRRRRVPLTDASDASVATPEDVIVSQLLFHARGGSDKHVSDVAGVLSVSAGQIDEEYIESWVARLGPEDAWRAAKDRTTG